MSAFHRHTDRLVNAEPHDALPGIETLVPAGIGHQNPLLLSKHVLDDGTAQGDFFLIADALAPADGLRLELAVGRTPKPKPTPFRLDGADNYLRGPPHPRAQ